MAVCDRLSMLFCLEGEFISILPLFSIQKHSTSLPSVLLKKCSGTMVNAGLQVYEKLTFLLAKLASSDKLASF